MEFLDLKNENEFGMKINFHFHFKSEFIFFDVLVRSKKYFQVLPSDEGSSISFIETINKSFFNSLLVVFFDINIFYLYFILFQLIQ